MEPVDFGGRCVRDDFERVSGRSVVSGVVVDISGGCSIVLAVGVFLYYYTINGVIIIVFVLSNFFTKCHPHH